jgi:hypothetical protein
MGITMGLLNLFIIFYVAVCIVIIVFAFLPVRGNR